MDLPLRFDVAVHQDRYLPAGATTVDAVVEVTALASSTVAPDAAQIVIVDCSSSMADKLAEAKRATETAIDTLPDGVAFAIVAGREYAELVYPHEGLAPADARTRAEARRAVHGLTADGGTALGSWLRLTGNLFLGHRAEVKHAIMLTDGRDEHETRRELAAALRSCERQFVCDARGVGDRWSGTELRLIASALHGSADGLAHPAELADDFRSMTAVAMGKALGAVTLRLWTPAGSAIRFVRQVFPQVDDLTGRRDEVSTRIGAYSTGAWGSEKRSFHLRLDLPPGSAGEERLAARIGFASGDVSLAESRVTATWTADRASFLGADPVVAHFTGQAELAAAIQEGIAAREAGDVGLAADWLGHAVQLADRTGNRGVAALLDRLVAVVGDRVHLRAEVSDFDVELANVRSVRTVRRTSRR